MSEQLAFALRRSLREVPPPGHRDGKTYSPSFDYERLNKQQRAVFDVMRSGRWLSLRQIADEAGCPEASASGPAFPTEPNTQPGFFAHHGMSLRDYFAGQVMAAYIVASSTTAGARSLVAASSEFSRSSLQG